MPWWIILAVIFLLLAILCAIMLWCPEAQVSSPSALQAPRAGRRRSSVLRGLRSSVVRVIVTDLRTGAKVKPEKFLQQAASEGKWMVADDSGHLVLQVMQHSVRFCMANISEFEYVLSHRWNPVINTDCGPVPAPMLDASFPSKTWVDFINHFNHPVFFQRVLHDMGNLYAQKTCRALYFEVENFSTQVEAASRSWMWQELSLGLQGHEYNSIQAMWLHHVVTVGDMETLISIGELAEVGLQATLLSAERRQLESRSWWHVGWDEGAVAFVKRMLVLWFVRNITYSKHPPSAELRSGTLGSVLQRIMGSQLGLPSPTRNFIDLLVGELSHLETVSDQLWGVTQIFCSVGSAVLEAYGRLVAARQNHEETTAMSLKLMSTVTKSLRFLQGQRPLNQELTRAAIELLQSGREWSTLSSALANLGNRNLQYDSDRLPASFGVLCAKQGLACEPPSVASMLLKARRANLICLPRHAALGVSLLARKRVHFAVRGDQTEPATRAVASYLMTRVAWIEGTWELVSISGLQIVDCYLLVAAHRVASLAGWKEGWGEVRQLTLHGDAVVHLKVWLDCSVMVRIGEPSMKGRTRGKRINLDRRAFTDWHASLEDV